MLNEVSAGTDSKYRGVCITKRLNIHELAQS